MGPFVTDGSCHEMFISVSDLAYACTFLACPGNKGVVVGIVPGVVKPKYRNEIVKICS